MPEVKLQTLSLSAKVQIIISLRNTFNRVFYTLIKEYELMSFSSYDSMWYLVIFVSPNACKQLIYIPENRSQKD